MKFVALAFTIALIFSGAAAAKVAAPVSPRAAQVSRGFVKRECYPSNCLCSGIPGLFCGDESINPDCTNGDVFQCNEDGHTCNFGRRDSCVQCGGLSC